MNWAGFGWALKWLIFWFFLIYGLFASSSNMFGDAPSWQTRWACAAIFIVFMLILTRVVL